MYSVNVDNKSSRSFILAFPQINKLLKSIPQLAKIMKPLKIDSGQKLGRWDRSDLGRAHNLACTFRFASLPEEKFNNYFIGLLCGT